MSLACAEMLTATITNDEKIIQRDNKIQGRLSIGDDSTDADTDNCYSDNDSNHRDELSTQPGSPAGSNASPLAVESKLPSAGSVGHFEGTCKRCCFFPKGRCSNGVDCQFCHFDHEKRTRTNKSMKKVSKDTVKELSFLLPPQGMGIVMPPPGLHAPPGLEPEPLPFTQLEFPRPVAGPAPPPAFAPMWNTGPAPPPAPAPQWNASSQPVLDVPSQGVPLKINLTQPFCPVLALDKTIPAHKRVPAHYGSATVLHLNPDLPAKKRIPECLLAY